MRELDDRVAIVKAHILGDGAQESNIQPAESDEDRIFSERGALTPPYPPDVLCQLLEHSCALRQNIDAYVTNIDGFGWRPEPVIDLDASDADQRIANAVALDKVGDTMLSMGEDVPLDALPNFDNLVSADQIESIKNSLRVMMRVEKSALENFFDFCCPESSFVALRRITRQDLEVLGNAYWEVIRNGKGQVAQFNYVPGFTVRLMPLDKRYTDVEVKVKSTDLKYERVSIRKRFRRFVQVFERR